MTLEELKAAIENFYSDTSRSRDQTRKGLEDAGSLIDAFLDSLQDEES